MTIKQVLKTAVGSRRVATAKRLVAPAVRKDLTRLGRLYGTDKSYAKHLYTPHYQRHFADMRQTPVRLLEIGIGGYARGEGGSSLRMWRSYFRRGDIHGLDLYEKSLGEPRVTTHVGSQADTEVLQRLGEAHGPFDIIIDDGSHHNEHIAISFGALFRDHLKPQGWYVIEDMATAYSPDFGGGPPNTPGRSVSLVGGLIEDLHRRFWSDPEGAMPVSEIHVYEQLAFIRRSAGT